MPDDLPPPLRRRVPLWAGVVLGMGALGAGAVVLPMLRLDPVPRVQQAPDLAAPSAVADLPGDLPDSLQDAAPDPRVPRFDLVRTDADGQTIVAGRTAPDMHVDLVVDGVSRAEARSDAAGQFVAFLTLGRSDAARVLWLVARDAAGNTLASDDTVILAPDTLPRPPQDGVDLAALGRSPTVSPVPGPSVATPDAAAPPAGTRDAVRVPGGPDDAPSLSGGISDTVALPRDPASPDASMARLGPGTDARPDVRDVGPRPSGATPDPVPRAAAAQPLLSDAEGVRVMAPAPLAGEALRVDSIAYGAEGAVVLRGRVAPSGIGGPNGPNGPNGIVRAILSGLSPVEVTPDVDGSWTLELPGVAPGDYRLDVARATAPGGVGTDTITLPFRRAAPEDVDAALSGDTARIVTVQPGATLWAIARDRYGDGTRYVQVYDANRGAIGDPDLIYPGQIFRLPDPAPR